MGASRKPFGPIVFADMNEPRWSCKQIPKPKCASCWNQTPSILHFARPCTSLHHYCIIGYDARCCCCPKRIYCYPRCYNHPFTSIRASCSAKLMGFSVEFHTKSFPLLHKHQITAAKSDSEVWSNKFSSLKINSGAPSALSNSSRI